MKYILTTLIITLSFLSLSQNYPVQTILKGDSVVIYTVEQNQDNCFAIVTHNSSNTDKKKLVIELIDNNENKVNETLYLNGQLIWYYIYNYNIDNNISISQKMYDIDDKLLKTHTITIDKNYIINQLPKNGYFKFK